MRKIIAGLFLSLDGVVEAPEVWTKPYMTEEIGQEVGSQMAECDTLLLGRVTYQTFAEAFTGPKADDPFAARLGGTPKYVVSTTLETVEWQNSTLVGGDLGRVAELKEQPGKDISVSGSPTLVRSLLGAGLLDELRLMVFPVVAGTGQRFFPESGPEIPLELNHSRTLDNGVVILRYAPA